MYSEKHDDYRYNNAKAQFPNASLDLEIAPARNAKNSSSSSLLLLLDGKAGDRLSKPKSVAFVAFVATGDGLTLLLASMMMGSRNLNGWHL